MAAELVDELDEIDGEPPFALKPAIKEHFFYATKAKAWRADSARSCAACRRALDIVRPGEVMVQELIPGDGAAAVRLLRALRGRRAGRDDGRPPPAAASARVRSREHVRRDDRRARGRGAVRKLLGHIRFEGLVELEYKLDPRNGAFKLLDFNARTWGYHTIAGEAGVDFPYLLYRRQLEQPVDASARAPASAGCGSSPICRPRSPRSSAATCEQATTCARCGVPTSRRSSAVEDPLPGLVELALIPYLSVKRGL